MGELKIEQGVTIVCKEHQKRFIRELMEEYPKAVGKPLKEEAEKCGGYIKVDVDYVPAHKYIKPFFDRNSHVLVVNN